MCDIFFSRELDLCRAVLESWGHARADLSEHFHDCSSQFLTTGLFVRPSRAFWLSPTELAQQKFEREREPKFISRFAMHGNSKFEILNLVRQANRALWRDKPVVDTKQVTNLVIDLVKKPIYLTWDLGIFISTSGTKILSPCRLSQFEPVFRMQIPANVVYLT